MIIIIGPFPPPVHGASLVTQEVAARLVDDRIPVVLCNTSPGNSSTPLTYHVKRVLAYIRCGRVILFSKRGTGRTATYVSLSGGLGLVYDCFIIALARLKRYEIIFHHHSFSYLTKRSIILRAIIRIAGADQLHIALCPIMAKRLGELYNSRIRTEVISNLPFIDVSGPDRKNKSSGIKVIGYLSNISFEKGIDRFFDLMTELRARGSRLVARIAGPINDNEMEKYIGRRMSDVGGVEYVGPVFGDDKSRFLSSIDVLVFPTRYINEAQPLVVYEAQAAGVVVSASERGCIAQMIPAELRLDSTASDLSKLVEKIIEWEEAPELFLAVQRESLQHRIEMENQRSNEAIRFNNLLSVYR